MAAGAVVDGNNFLENFSNRIRNIDVEFEILKPNQFVGDLLIVSA